MRILNPSVKQIKISDEGLSFENELLFCWRESNATLCRAGQDIWHGDPETVSFPTHSGKPCLVDRAYASDKGLLDRRVVLVENLAQKVTYIFTVPMAVLAKIRPYLASIMLEPPVAIED